MGEQKNNISKPENAPIQFDDRTKKQFEAMGSSTVQSASKAVSELGKGIIDAVTISCSPYVKNITESVRTSLVELGKQYVETLTPVIQDITIKLSETLKNIDFSYLFEIQKKIDALPVELQKDLPEYAKKGWYYDSSMGVICLNMVRRFSAKDKSAINDFFVDYFERRVNTIEERLCKCYPQRKTILKKAFEAHKNGDYELSVPVFLSQADGLCFDKLHKSFFRVNERKSIIDFIDKEVTSEFQKALFSPLSVPLPITASHNERTEDFYNLNRHMILHGESTNYGTQEFSCKAISFLNYLAIVLNGSNQNE